MSALVTEPGSFAKNPWKNFNGNDIHRTRARARSGAFYLAIMAKPPLKRRIQLSIG